MSRLDLAKLHFGDVVEGDRGDRLMIVTPAAMVRTAQAIVLQPERGPYPDRVVGERITIYPTWDLRLRQPLSFYKDD